MGLCDRGSHSTCIGFIKNIRAYYCLGINYYFYTETETSHHYKWILTSRFLKMSLLCASFSSGSVFVPICLLGARTYLWEDPSDLRGVRGRWFPRCQPSTVCGSPASLAMASLGPHVLCTAQHPSPVCAALGHLAGVGASQGVLTIVWNSQCFPESTDILQGMKNVPWASRMSVLASHAPHVHQMPSQRPGVIELLPL